MKEHMKIGKDLVRLSKIMMGIGFVISALLLHEGGHILNGNFTRGELNENN